MILVDSNIVFDVLDRDPSWAIWSSEQLRRLSLLDELAINLIIYAETSARFSTPARLNEKLDQLGLIVHEIPREAAFLAGRAHAQYRKQGGARSNVLAEFFIGAHAAVSGCRLLTRDTRRYRTYFPRVPLIAPDPVC